MNGEELIGLLGSWQDYFPFPSTWTGDLQRRSAKRGPAPFRVVRCEECDGVGKPHGWPCKACDGLGVFEIDDYTGLVVNAGDATWAELLSGTVNCSTCGGWGRLGAHAETRPEKDARLCPTCDGTGKVPALLSRLADGEGGRARQGDRTLDALSDQAEKRDRLHCYQELAAALDRLRARAPGVCFVVCWVYVIEAQKPSRANLPALVAGLRFLLGELEHVRAPTLIRRQSENRRAALVLAKGRGADVKAQAARNDLIRRRDREGATRAELVAEFDIDKSRISRILRGVG